MPELQTIRTGMTREEESAVHENNARALAHGFVRNAVAWGLDAPASSKDKDAPTWISRGEKLFPRAWASALFDYLLELADLVMTVGEEMTVTELARRIRAVEPDADLCSLENRRRLHAALGACPRYAAAPARRCAITLAETSNVWKREG